MLLIDDTGTRMIKTSLLFTIEPIKNEYELAVRVDIIRANTKSLYIFLTEDKEL